MGADGFSGEANDDPADVQNLRITRAAGIQTGIKIWRINEETHLRDISVPVERSVEVN